jgi:hypothetical protein
MLESKARVKCLNHAHPGCSQNLESRFLFYFFKKKNSTDNSKKIMAND